MVHAESAPPRGDGGGCRRWWCPPKARASRLLLLLFVELQLADIVSTNAALAMPGVWEANPLMALSQAELGPAWWLPKAAAAVLCSVAAPLLRRSWPLVFAVAYYAIIVGDNLAQL
jgi:Domain of unknown function (DUF5658)